MLRLYSRKIALSLLSSGVLRYLIPAECGAGVVFTLHKVMPVSTQVKADPNSHLSITPEFLEEVAGLVLDAGYIPLSLAELPGFLQHRKSNEKAVFFTLDDGYKNNLKYAVPIFEKYNIPCTIMLTSGFLTRTKSMWWETASEVVTNAQTLQFDFGAGMKTYNLDTRQSKIAMFHKIKKFICQAEVEEEAIRTLDEFAYHSAGVDPLKLVDQLIMNESDVRNYSDIKIIEFGAHTASHLNLKKIPDGQLRSEIERSISSISALTGKTPASFAYPYGGDSAVGSREIQAVRDSAIRVAVTTRPNVLKGKHIGELLCLPRISLNGHFQQISFVRTLLGGVPFIFSR
ncbi:polysaccharide deacetylase family protein [Labrenzia sp. CE80]|uniref:polysaccharide deacetylase family protein n=1 Tax=Labrenzia sp. CE80 TaxID=1788986 RepID=UPI00129BC9DE|nr:polysaccharide deacetylase family protein [Labrenzia sp. CE80]